MGERVWIAINLAGGLLLVTDQAGDTEVFEPGDHIKPSYENRLSQEDQGNSTIAFVEGQPFLGTRTNLYAIGSGKRRADGGNHTTVPKPTKL